MALILRPTLRSLSAFMGHSPTEYFRGPLTVHFLKRGWYAIGDFELRFLLFVIVW